jgi:hypothetical protein
MKIRHIEAYRVNARAILTGLKIGIGQDFHTLSREQVDGLLTEANRVRYQQPKTANGSRARYFHDRLQRQAGL